MTLLEEVTQIVLASIGSSGIILFAGKFLLDKFIGKRIEHHFNERLEDHKASLVKDVNKDLEGIRSSYVMQQEEKKAELTLKTQDSLELYKIHREKYPPLSELIYRIRNTARDKPSTEDLKNLVSQLTEMMIQLKAYLDHDALHVKVHSFKNIALAFVNRQADRTALLEQNKTAEAEEARAAAERLFDELDQQYSKTTGAIAHFIAAS